MTKPPGWAHGQTTHTLSGAEWAASRNKAAKDALEKVFNAYTQLSEEQFVEYLQEEIRRLEA